MNYADFIAHKAVTLPPAGIEPGKLPAALKPFQRDIVAWALRRGRAALFEGTGLGKTVQQLAWADAVEHDQGAPVLVFCPLAVAQQTVAEAAKFGIAGVAYAADESAITSRIVVTNYDRLDRFDPDRFAGIVLDESSIIKSHDSKTRAALVERFRDTRFKLCCTATPAPNDYVELGNHAEFLGVMTEKEMLSMYFVHDGSIRASDAGQDGWRLKGHAQHDFWAWVASWSVLIRSPADLGYDEPGYDLPPLHKRQITVRAEVPALAGQLFAMEAVTLSERIGARRGTVTERVRAAAEIVNAQPDRPWLVWCHRNDEADALVAAIPGAVEVRGPDPVEQKIDRLIGFAEGRYRVLVSKPSICGHGMNFQRCADMVFVGLNDSFEQLFQAIRRCWRFGQAKPVNAHLIAADIEGAVVANLQAKEADFDAMCAAMVAQMRDLSIAEVRHVGRRSGERVPTVTMELPPWLIAA